MQVALHSSLPPAAAKALRLSLAEGALHAVMVGIAESYLGAFAVELGHGGSRLALLATLPLFMGACAQLLSPAATRWVGARKRLVVAGAVSQALSLGGLIAIAWAGDGDLAPLLITKCIFWVSASVMVPAWNAWMGDLTAREERARYFARRSGITHVALLVAFALAGLFLQQAGTGLMQRYAALFSLALVARLASATLLWRQYDVAPPLTAEGRKRSRFHWRKALQSSDFRVPRYLALLALGTQVAGPFFTPFMLRDLNLGYGTYAALSALSILSKAVTFPLCHRLATRLGLRSLLMAGGAAVIVIPLFWASSTSVPALIVVHLFGGAAWASVEYSSFQLQLASSSSDVTAEFFSISNALTGAASISGALAGGYLLQHGTLDYQHVFLLSAALRALPLTLLAMAFRRADYPVQLRAVYTRLLSVRPGAGAAQRPIVMSNAATDGTDEPS